MGALSIRTVFLKHHRLDGERLGALAFSTVEDLQDLVLAAFRFLEDTLVAVGLAIGAADWLVDQRADPLTLHSICIKIELPGVRGRERERERKDLLPELADPGVGRRRDIIMRTGNQELFVRVMTDSDY